jgi:hypothetical protein
MTVVDVYNPNSYDVAIRAMRGQVVMGNNYSLPVDFRPPGNGVWLTSSRTTSVRVPINSHSTWGCCARLRRGAVHPLPSPGRRCDGVEHVSRRERRLRVDEQGTISRQQIAAIIPSWFASHGPM